MVAYRNIAELRDAVRENCYNAQWIEKNGYLSPAQYISIRPAA